MFLLVLTLTPIFSISLEAGFYSPVNANLALAKMSIQMTRLGFVDFDMQV